MTTLSTQSGIANPRTGGKATVASGQLAVTAAAQALPAQGCSSVLVKVQKTGTQTVYAGPTGVTDATGFEMNAGDSQMFPVSNTNLLSFIAAGTGSTVSWIAFE
jgi:hypothetical protein